MIGQWTTVTNWTTEGSPYLWWTGPDQAVILQAVVNWGLSADLLAGKKVGVIAGDRASDQLALKQYLLPDLSRAGVTPVVKTIASDPADTATTDTQAPLVVQQLRSAGVTSVIPLIPFNVFYPVLQAETDQQYFPKLLLSDYESSIESALGPPARPLREGPRRPGGPDHRDPRWRDRRRPPTRARAATTPACAGCWIPSAQGLSPDPAGRHQPTSSRSRDPSVGWCQAITLFATAAKAAGPDLNRRTFVTAMSKITELPGHQHARS